MEHVIGLIIITVLLVVVVIVYGVVSGIIRGKHAKTDVERQDIMIETIMTTALCVFFVLGVIILLIGIGAMGGWNEYFRS